MMRRHVPSDDENDPDYEVEEEGMPSGSGQDDEDDDPDYQVRQ